MLEGIVRKLFKIIGFEEVSDQDLLRFIRFSKLDKLPPHLLFALTTIFPIIELIVKRLLREEIDWSELSELEPGSRSNI
jgi:hypothetical protein